MSNTPRTDEEVEIAKRFPATNHGLWVSAEFARQLEREMNRLYCYLEECQDAMLDVLSAGDDPDGMADLQRKITNCLASRQR